ANGRVSVRTAVIARVIMEERKGADGSVLVGGMVETQRVSTKRRVPRAGGIVFQRKSTNGGEAGLQVVSERLGTDSRVTEAINVIEERSRANCRVEVRIAGIVRVIISERLQADGSVVVGDVVVKERESAHARVTGAGGVFLQRSKTNGGELGR